MCITLLTYLSILWGLWVYNIYLIIIYILVITYNMCIQTLDFHLDPGYSYNKFALHIFKKKNYPKVLKSITYEKFIS